MSLQNKKILLGVTGSIAAYKAAELTRLLKKAGAQVQVVMTQSAQQFITGLTLQTLSGNPVHCDQWQAELQHPMLHIDLARWADLILIAPASADCIARLSYGRADDLLAALCLASTAPKMLAPAMNQQMWLNPLTQENVQRLRKAHYHVLETGSGEQACGEVGPGRMLEPEEILQSARQFFSAKQIFANVKVLITAGPTREPIDPVRYLSNHSSGKMGYALAQAFVDAGAHVTLITGPTSIAKPPVQRLTQVETAAQMHAAVMACVAEQDIFVSAAAVADYAVANVASQKIKKSAAELQLSLKRNPDILREVAALPERPYCIGFAAETENLLEHAQHKLHSKGVDMIVANLITTEGPFSSDDNEVVLLFPDQPPQYLHKQSKLDIANQIITVSDARLFSKKSSDQEVTQQNT